MTAAGRMRSGLGGPCPALTIWAQVGEWSSRPTSSVRNRFREVYRRLGTGHRSASPFSTAACTAELSLLRRVLDQGSPLIEAGLIGPGSLKTAVTDLEAG